MLAFVEKGGSKIFTNLITDRLLIRRFIAEDWQELHEYHSDPLVVKYEIHPPFSEEQSKQGAEYYSKSPHYWAVCLKESGRLIGHIFLVDNNQFVWMFGYAFNRKYHKNKYATEAGAAMIDYVFHSRNAHRITAECNIENIASYRLLERLGFQREGRLRQHIYFHCDEQGKPIWIDSYIYALLAQDRQNQPLINYIVK